MTVMEYGAGQSVFDQGKPAGSIFYIRKGKVKLSVTSKQDKEAIIAILSAGNFFGEGCLAAQMLRMALDETITNSSLLSVILHD